MSGTFDMSKDPYSGGGERKEILQEYFNFDRVGWNKLLSVGREVNEIMRDRVPIWKNCSIPWRELPEREIDKVTELLDAMLRNEGVLSDRHERDSEQVQYLVTHVLHLGWRNYFERLRRKERGGSSTKAKSEEETLDASLAELERFFSAWVDGSLELQSEDIG